ncbi:alkene reductase, partial [Pseudomonas sp. FEN]|uniref:alkene reductase n=1 Tax=Pseudomonas sp. FEN TaxID=2767468 RepID=UPI001748AE74
MTDLSLFQPLALGGLKLRNRIALPPLTRSRSSQPGNVPNDLMATYYTQRATAGFMVTEGTQIEPRGQGYAWTPGIHSEAQVEGWRKVTEAVHAQGGVIFCQLWHVGRVSHTSLQPNNQPPVAPSAIRASAVKVSIETGPETGALADPSEPVELTTPQVRELVEFYHQAAINAKKAGFDGVELHCANGYLVNQFISEHTNQRTDEYGGSLDNRLRFLREVCEATIRVFGGERVGVRFAPLFESTDEERVYLGLVEQDPHQTYVQA